MNYELPYDEIIWALSRQIFSKTYSCGDTNTFNMTTFTQADFDQGKTGNRRLQEIVPTQTKPSYTKFVHISPVH